MALDVYLSSMRAGTLLVRRERDYFLVRVGGGYMGIREFIEEHAEVEASRLERKGSSSSLFGGVKVATTDSTPFLSATGTVTTFVQKSPRSKSSGGSSRRIYFN